MLKTVLKIRKKQLHERIIITVLVCQPYKNDTVIVFFKRR